MSIRICSRDIRLALAPMAGFTDSAMRALCYRFGADVTFTEMISAKAVVFGDKKTHALAKIGKDEGPCILQLFGSDPQTLATASGIMSSAREGGVSPVGIDINMGCPVHKIFSNGEGSALMKNPALIYKIVKAVKSEIDLPLSVKLRLGTDKENINVVECALSAEAGGADFITVHGRTRTQMYSGACDLESIADVKRALHIPLIANGDITDGQSAKRALSITGADAIMIGRGAIGNPFIFGEIKAVLDGGAPPEITLDLKRRTAIEQLKATASEKGECTAVLEARKQLALYFKGMRGASALRGALNQATTIDEVEQLLAEIADIVD